MSAPAIETQAVGAAYRLAHSRPMSVKEYGLLALRRRIRHEWLWAVREVSFTVGRGELLAIIGPNGAGKSTLLKLIARVLSPAEGRLVVRGHVAPMIELGIGMNPDLTGRENVLLAGAMLGHGVRHMRHRIEDIAEWAGVSEFLDVPLRGYSSGMTARLAFAVATEGSPDVLLVDEVLSVGDEEFRARSEDRIARMMRDGATVVLVSHALELVSRIADRVLWMDGGRARALGGTGVVDSYIESIVREGPPGLSSAGND
jgi:ABC-2 type transport system ATP-binding protein